MTEQTSTPQSVRMFINGQALRGGSLSDALATSRFLTEIRTAPKYRFFSVRDEFPGLVPDEVSGASIEGEIYHMDLADLRDQLLPREPSELELTVIEMADGSGSFSMRLRPGLEPQFRDITEFGGWRKYLASLT